MIIDLTDIQDVVYMELVNKGYAPGEAEIQDIAEVMLTYIKDLFYDMGFDVVEDV